MFFLISILIAIAHSWTSPVAAQGGGQDQKTVDVLLQNIVAAEDGTPLAITIWKPGPDNQRYPTVLVATPYVSDEAHPRARKYADRGYAMASLDLRGRGGSKGEFIPFSDHGTDICDAIAWIKEQPWSDDNVVMRGGSYRGMTQWMAARSCPDEIETMIPTASVYPGYDFPIVAGHRSQKYTAGWLGFVAGSAMNPNFYTDSDYWRERTSYRDHVPFSEYDAFIGLPSEHFQTWVNRLSEPEAWAASAWEPNDYAQMHMSVLTVTGYYDGDQPGALRYFREHQEGAPQSAAINHYLVMGPWSHGGTREPRQKLSEGVEFGPAAVFDMDQFNLDWFDWRLGRGAKPDLLKRRIAYYVGGAEEWRYANKLDEISSERRKFYLSATPDEAYDVFRSGHLVDAPVNQEEPHRFRSDPLDTSPADLTDTDWNAIRDGSLRSTVPAYMPETLIFHSPPLDKGLTLAGQMRLRLYLEMDTPDADIFVTVYAMFPDGQPLYLGGDVVRARFRNGLKPSLVEPGVVEAYEFKNFLWNAWALPEGTRLRLTVGPYNDPSAQKNYNSGGRLGFETLDDARVAQIKLYHSTEYPSVLEIPVVAD
ncbi:CocE/NonD family hydrolase [Parasphingorhabdus cellanae]|uniref:CocE/NonD family hydrolase n=1 Tax=Parasphingorhabdus cellanae TaxID=2806553 RepID=A0ABX7TA68_9SPHN|nr:CocE/NonD family hydrolase [Parasphingorhabdus cellanae]QTD57315.1 CocE/NonD family hydrolase [Parasphingorhabdus cellanae]